MKFKTPLGVILERTQLEAGRGLRYESYMVSEADLVNPKSPRFGGFRQAEVDNPCFVCRGVKNEVLVSTTDVIHSWGVPELGIKIDAVPGRINSGRVVPVETGFFYGFCYELCGSGHREIPIAVVCLELEEYMQALTRIFYEKGQWSVKFGPNYKPLWFERSGDSLVKNMLVGAIADYTFFSSLKGK